MSHAQSQGQYRARGRRPDCWQRLASGPSAQGSVSMLLLTTARRGLTFIGDRDLRFAAEVNDREWSLGTETELSVLDSPGA